MGLMDKIKGEFIDIIEWQQSAHQGDVLAYRFPRYNNEIKIGAQLTVREGQQAIFVNEGKIADVFGPGRHELTTRNLPILSTLMGWKYGFDSPFKADVYFVVTAQQPDHKWGTANPIMMRDQDFGMIRLRGYGSYVFQVVDCAKFLRMLVATDPTFEDYEIDSQLRQTIVAKFSDVVGNCKIPVLDLVGNYEKLSRFVLDSIKPDFADWGLEIKKFWIENLSLPPAVEEAIDRRTQIGVVGDLEKYTRFQAAEALRDAANAGGDSAAGMGVGLGGGMVMAQSIMQSMGPAAGGPSMPPPLPTPITFHVERNGQAAGPFAVQSIAAMIQSGQLTANTLVWRPGMQDWQIASAVPELAGMFGAVPPPLPPK